MKNKESKDKQRSWKNFKDLFRNLGYFGRLLFKCAPFAASTIIIFSIVRGVFPVFVNKIFGTLIDTITNFIQSGNSQQVWYILMIYILIKSVPDLIGAVYDYVDKYWYIKFSNYIDVHIQRIRGSHEIARIENPKYQDLVQRAFNNGYFPISMIIEQSIENIRRIILFLSCSIAVVFIDWRIFVITIVAAIPSFIVEIFYGGALWHIWGESSREMRLYEEFGKYFTSKQGVIESKLFGIQKSLISKIEVILDNFFRKQIKIEKKRSWLKLAAEIFSSVGFYGSLALAIMKALDGSISIGTVVFLFTALAALYNSASELLTNLARQLERNLYASDIYEVLNIKTQITNPKRPEKIDYSVTPEIEFRNVSFKYPDQEHQVLTNLSFKIFPGEKLALVGHNGAGKTTIVRLLLRIHDPVEGEIYINGIDLKKIDYEKWWGILGVLFQDYSTFNFSAKESIAYGDITRRLDIDKVKKSAEQSTASNFIGKWKDGYDTMIGVEFGGEELSKGERQKMALARVFYRDAKVYVLDEPTAAVDAPSASEIFRNIENLPEDKSALLISHNFATIRRANKIVVLEHGKIVEEGTHDELVDKNGLYNSLYNQQKNEYN